MAFRQAIDLVLSSETYDEVKVSHWVDSICESCMKGLTDLQKPFKYVGVYRAVRD
jgi:dynein light chain Tctex-type 1